MDIKNFYYYIFRGNHSVQFLCCMGNDHVSPHSLCNASSQVGNGTASMCKSVKSKYWQYHGIFSSFVLKAKYLQHFISHHDFSVTQ